VIFDLQHGRPQRGERGRGVDDFIIVSP